MIPLAKPVIGPREEELVLEVLRSGQLSLGPRVPAFEEAFAARVGAEHACAVSSGTTGLHLALRAVGVEEGDEVVWAAMPDDDPRAQAHDIYDWVGYLQETLVQALSGR